MKKILKIAVTGSAGSGKSLVCKRFGQLGLVILDCDQIARQIVEPGEPAYKKVVALFGEGILQKNKEFDRLKLRNIIVDQPDKRAQLEGILHPGILDELWIQIKTAAFDKEYAVAVEVPLLFELSMEKQFDVTVTVAAKEVDLVKRISCRDDVPQASAQKVLDLQMPQQHKIDRSDYVIWNAGKTQELYDAVDNLYMDIKKNS